MWKVLITPACWIQNYDYSKAWDIKLKKLMEENKFTGLDLYTARLGNQSIWIANHPYASFTSSYLNVRPKRSTILYAWDKLEKDYYEL